MEREIHVLMFPLPAFGHLTPYYQLALALSKYGIHVHFVATPNNIMRLPTPPNNLSSHFHFVKIPMPMIESSPLPIGAEATSDISFDMWKYLIAAYDMLEDPLKDIVYSLKLDWLIVDLRPIWATKMGHDVSARVMCFPPLCAAALLFFSPPEHLLGEGHDKFRYTLEGLTLPPPWVDFPSTVAYRNYEMCKMLKVICEEFKMPEIIHDKGAADKMFKSLKDCDAVAVRSCYEFEGDYLPAYAKIVDKHVIPVGLLTSETSRKTDFTNTKWMEIFTWLDKQKEKSVIFVGFGSECRLKKEEIHEIARGLEISKLPFFWILRRPDWSDSDGTDVFPRDFLKNTSELGQVFIGWAPQLEILGHMSIGVSLFHSGWGSAIEAIQFGLRLVVLPFIFDQPLNARMLVEKGLAIEVDRDEDGSFSGEQIAKVLREALIDGDEGESLKEAAAFTNNKELQKRYMAKFVEFLKHGITMKKI